MGILGHCAMVQCAKNRGARKFQEFQNFTLYIVQVSHKTWVFPQTVFTAVTAYQNQLVLLWW